MEILLILAAFILGLCARLIGLPPLIGYLCAGFILHALHFESSLLLETIANMGITLLLFCIGLKIDIKKLLNINILSSATLHISLTTLAFTGIILFFAALQILLFSELTFIESVLIAFAASFSSTVCAIKVMSDKGEIGTRHGELAILLLVIQDIVAVIFLAVINKMIPSIWALGLLLLPFARKPLLHLLEKVGHDELLCLVGFVLAFGGGNLFYSLGVKADLGALVFGMLLANHNKTHELYKSLTNIKDLLLVAFFLSIGFQASITKELIMTALLFTCLIPLKAALYFVCYTGFRFRARASLLATLNLFNYSEFGLIVASIGYSQGILPAEWIVVLALCIGFTFVINILISANSHFLYATYKHIWVKFQKPKPLAEDVIDIIQNKSVIVIGMGRVGKVVYDTCDKQFGHTICGIDTNRMIVNENKNEKRNVVFGDATSMDFWERQDVASYDLVIITTKVVNDIIEINKQIRSTNFNGKIFAIALYNDEKKKIEASGVDLVFNYHEEAGLGYASDVIEFLQDSTHAPNLPTS